jgi:hypothetical protein
MPRWDYRARTGRQTTNRFAFETQEDLFSGISLTIEKPYQLGDDVLLEEGIEGQVVQINWWSTHLLGIFSSAMNEPPRASFKKHG